MSQYLSTPLAISLLTPAFAWAGAALVSIPIIIHILNRRRFKVMNWAAMEFLLRAMRKNRRRLRFEQWLLLVTRCLLMALLGLALARPMGCENGAIAALGRRSSLNIFVIDNSYSTGYEANRPGAKTHLQQAKLIAKALLDRPTSGGVSVAVVAAARPAKPIISKPGFDLMAAKAAVDRIEPSLGATDLVGALQAALQIARDEPNQPNKNLYLITDGTRSAFEGQQSQALKDLGPELARTFRISHYNLGEGKPQWNAAVTQLVPSSGLVTNKFPTDFKAVLQGYGTAHDGTVQWKLDDLPLEGGGNVRIDGKVELSQSHAVFRNGGAHVLSVSLVNDDKLQADNSRLRVVDVASELKTLVVEGKHGINPLEGSAAFILAALAPARDTKDPRGETNSYVAPELISDLELSNKLLTDYSLVVLADVAQFTEDEADRLKRFVEQGGTLMYFMGDSVLKENYNAALVPRKLLPGPLVKLVSVGADQRGYTFDFRPEGVLHPFLGAFSHQEDTGIDKAQVFTYWQVDVAPGKGVETVLGYVSPELAAKSGAAPAPTPSKAGDPAITHQLLGQGHIVFVSTLANKEWTNLPAHPNFLSLLHEIVLGSARTGDYWMNLSVGERLVIPGAVRLTGAPLLTDPNEQPVVLQPPQEKSAATYEQTYHTDLLTKPGLYHLNLGASSVPIAVNVPAEDEANVFTMTDAAIRKALGDVEIREEGAKVPADVAAIDREGNDFSWWCMAMLMGLIGVECVMAMRFGHYRRAGVATV